jgi:hypothetical protein
MAIRNFLNYLPPMIRPLSPYPSFLQLKTGFLPYPVSIRLKMIFLLFPILHLLKKAFLLYLDSLMMAEMTFLLCPDSLMMVEMACRPFRVFPEKTVVEGCLLCLVLILPTVAYLLFPHSLNEVSKNLKKLKIIG